MEIPDSVLVDKIVLVIWHGGTTRDTVQSFTERLRDRVGEKGRVVLENADRLEACELSGL